MRHGLASLALTILAACTGVRQEQVVSECGGFPLASAGQALQGLTAAQVGSSYCDAEVLAWTYDAGAQRLSITDSRVLLNCCGEHSITIDSPAAGRYVLDEVDEPEGSLLGGARCGCMCVFDFQLVADEIPARVIHLKLRRDVTDDDSGTTLIWEGDWDLHQGEGSEIIDQTDVGPWCSAG